METNHSAPWLSRQPVYLVLQFQLSATGGPWKDGDIAQGVRRAHSGGGRGHTLVIAGGWKPGESGGLRSTGNSDSSL